MRSVLLLLVMAFLAFGQEEPPPDGEAEAPPQQEAAEEPKPEPPPKPKKKRSSKKLTVWPNENLYWLSFVKNTEKLTPAGSKRLDEAIRILAAFPRYEVKLRSFAPAKALARKRAAAVRDLLTSWRPKPEEDLGLKLQPIQDSRIEIEVKAGPRSGVELDIVRRLWRRGS